MVAVFDTDLRRGQGGEAVLTAFFRSAGYEVRPVDRAGQRKGVDVIWTHGDGRRWTVEYKTDWTAERTGRAFVETVSVDSAGKLGWALVSYAQLLVYHLPISRVAHVCHMSLIREALPGWMARYGQKVIPNSTYNTEGIAVPFDVLLPTSCADTYNL